MKSNACILAFICLVFCTGAPATAQNGDFLRPRQKGPFAVNGLMYLEVAGGFTDPVPIGQPVPTIDQIVPEFAATGANLVKIPLTLGFMRRYNDNGYDPSIPLEYKPENVLAFGRKLAAKGIPCLFNPHSAVLNVIAGSSDAGSDRPNPADRRVWMEQHVPRLIAAAKLAENLGCEYLAIFADEIEHLFADPNLEDQWAEAILGVRHVFSGRLTCLVGFFDGVHWLSRHSPRLIGMLDVLGIGFFPAYTDKIEPTVDELAASYRKNKNGNDTLRALSDLHLRYGKPILITDLAYGSFRGVNLGQEQIYRLPREQLKVDYQAQVNLWESFFQAMTAFGANWMLGVVGDSFDRLPYEWKDRAFPPYLGSAGESLRGKPALQTLAQWYQSSTPVTAPVTGWWHSPQSPGRLYALEVEAGVARLAALDYSANGEAEWSWTRCLETAPGKYVGRRQFYRGGGALNSAPAQPREVMDGSPIALEFRSPTMALLTTETGNLALERYQFSDQWASSAADAPRAGWWDRVEQSGRGYFIERQGNTALVGCLVYSEDGRPTWFTASGPLDANRVFAGRLTFCSTRPPQEGDATTPACAPADQTIRIAFASPWRATLSVGNEQPVEIQRHRAREIGWAGSSPEFTSRSVVNAASFRQGMTPGGLVSLRGTGLTRGVDSVVAAPLGQLPLSLRGTSVTVNGVPAPVYAISSANGEDRIDFQVPYELAGQKSAAVIVTNNGAQTGGIQVEVFDIHPALFTTDGTHVVAHRADGTVVTAENAPMSGEPISIYAAGLGPVMPTPATGAPAGSEPRSAAELTPIVHFNARNPDVLFVGLVPGAVGLYQIDVMVPDRIGIGDLTLYISAGGMNSNVVKIPVQSGQYRSAGSERGSRYQPAREFREGHPDCTPAWWRDLCRHRPVRAQISTAAMPAAGTSIQRTNSRDTAMIAWRRAKAARFTNRRRNAEGKRERTGSG